MNPYYASVRTAVGTVKDVALVAAWLLERLRDRIHPTTYPLNFNERAEHDD